MPTVQRIGRWRLHFYSDEGHEPPHVHVDTGEGECKFWLAPVRLARSQRVNPLDVRRIERAVLEHETALLEAWNEFFRS